MAKQWTDEEVQKEIKDAIAIVREDRFETYVRGRLGTPSGNPNDPPNPGNPGNGDPNPNPSGDPPKAKKSLWWGETE